MKLNIYMYKNDKPSHLFHKFAKANLVDTIGNVHLSHLHYSDLGSDS